MGKTRSSMDIIEFVEKVCGCPLLDYQKEFLRRMQNVSRGDYQMLCLRSGRIVLVPEAQDGYESDICFVDEIECLRDKTYKLQQQEFAQREIGKLINAVGKDAGNGL